MAYKRWGVPSGGNDGFEFFCVALPCFACGVSMILFLRTAT